MYIPQDRLQVIQQYFEQRDDENIGVLFTSNASDIEISIISFLQAPYIEENKDYPERFTVAMMQDAFVKWAISHIKKDNVKRYFETRSRQIIHENVITQHILATDYVDLVTALSMDCGNPLTLARKANDILNNYLLNFISDGARSNMTVQEALKAKIEISSNRFTADTQEVLLRIGNKLQAFNARYNDAYRIHSFYESRKEQNSLNQTYITLYYYAAYLGKALSYNGLEITFPKRSEHTHGPYFTITREKEQFNTSVYAQPKNDGNSENSDDHSNISKQHNLYCCAVFNHGLNIRFNEFHSRAYYHIYRFCDDRRYTSQDIGALYNIYSKLCFDASSSARKKINEANVIIDDSDVRKFEKAVNQFDRISETSFMREIRREWKICISLNSNGQDIFNRALERFLAGNDLSEFDDFRALIISEMNIEINNETLRTYLLFLNCNLVNISKINQVAKSTGRIVRDYENKSFKNMLEKIKQYDSMRLSQKDFDLLFRDFDLTFFNQMPSDWDSQSRYEAIKEFNALKLDRVSPTYPLHKSNYLDICRKHSSTHNYNTIKNKFIHRALAYDWLHIFTTKVIPYYLVYLIHSWAASTSMVELALFTGGDGYISPAESRSTQEMLSGSLNTIVLDLSMMLSLISLGYNICARAEKAFRDPSSINKEDLIYASVTLMLQCLIIFFVYFYAPVTLTDATITSSGKIVEQSFMIFYKIFNISKQRFFSKQTIGALNTVCTMLPKNSDEFKKGCQKSYHFVKNNVAYVMPLIVANKN